NLLQLATGGVSGAAQATVAEGKAAYTLGVGGISFVMSLIQDKEGGQAFDYTKAAINAGSSMVGRGAVTASTRAVDSILARFGIQPLQNSAPGVIAGKAIEDFGVSTLTNQGLSLGLNFLPKITAFGGVTTVQYANGGGFQITSTPQNTPQTGGS